MAPHEVQCGRVQHRPHDLVEKARRRPLQFGRRPLAPWRGGKIDIGVDIQPPGHVVLVEAIVAAQEFLAVGPAELDDEFTEGVVGVARQQRSVEVEQGQVHRAAITTGGDAAASTPPSSASICRSSGTVTWRERASA